MDSPSYDIFITGKFVEGADPSAAKQAFAQLFKLTPEKAERFFDGGPQLLKRGIDKPAALKYKAALHKAGIMVAFKAHEAGAAAKQPAEPGNADTGPASQNNAVTDQPLAAADKTVAASGALSIAPAGSDVLKPDERQAFVPAEIDTSAIGMASVFSAPESLEQPAPPAPDTSHISVAAAGADILVDKPAESSPLPLDLDAISLAPAGTELEELHEEKELLDPDISQLSMAEAGADLLEGQVKAAPPPAPDTAHIQLSPES